MRKDSKCKLARTDTSYKEVCRSLTRVSEELHKKHICTACDGHQIHEHSIDGIKKLEVVIKMMQKASNHWTTEMHLSKADVHTLLGCLTMAQNRFRDNLAVVGPDAILGPDVAVSSSEEASSEDL